MTQEVIDCILHFGKKENVLNGVIIRNLHGNVKVNDFETDDIEGVYGYNLKQNLYPNIQHEVNNQMIQNDEVIDVTNSNSDSKSANKSNSNSDSINNNDNNNIEIIRNENGNEQPPKETVVEELEGDLESIVQELENNMDAEIEAFNEIDNNINNVLQDMEDIWIQILL